MEMTTRNLNVILVPQIKCPTETGDPTFLALKVYLKHYNLTVLNDNERTVVE